MPLYEDYTVEVSISWTVKAAGKFVCGGAAPGEASGNSDPSSTRLSMTEAFKQAVDQAAGRAAGSVQGSNQVRRRELGYPDGH